MTLRDLLLFVLVVAGIIIGTAEQAHATIVVNAGVRSPVPMPQRITAPAVRPGTGGYNGAELFRELISRHRDTAGRTVDSPFQQLIRLPPGSIATAGRAAARALPYATLAVTAAELLSELLANDLSPGEYIPGGPDGGYQEWLRSVEGTTDPTQQAEVSSSSCPSSASYNCTEIPGQPTTFSLASAFFHVGQMITVGGVCLTGTWREPTGELLSSGNLRAASQCLRTTDDGYLAQATVIISPSGSAECPPGYSLVEGQCVGTLTVEATDADLQQAIQTAAPPSLSAIANEAITNGFPVEVPPGAASEVQFVQEGGGLGSSRTQSSLPVVTTQTVYDEFGTPTTYETVNVQNITTTTEGSTASTTTITTNVTNVSTTYNTTTNTIVNESTEEVPLAGPGSSSGTDEATDDTVIDPVTEQPRPEGDDQGEPEPTGNFEDSEFPEVPDLYEQKYENGLVGVWQDKQGDLMATQFITDVQSIFLDVPGSGTCPAWSISMINLGPTNFSDGDISVPCWLWDVVGLILLVTACFRAWSIVFG